MLGREAESSHWLTDPKVVLVLRCSSCVAGRRKDRTHRTALAQARPIRWLRMRRSLVVRRPRPQRGLDPAGCLVPVVWAPRAGPRQIGWMASRRINRHRLGGGIQLRSGQPATHLPLRRCSASSLRSASLPHEETGRSQQSCVALMTRWGWPWLGHGDDQLVSRQDLAPLVRALQLVAGVPLVQDHHSMIRRFRRGAAPSRCWKVAVGSWREGKSRDAPGRGVVSRSLDICFRTLSSLPGPSSSSILNLELTGAWPWPQCDTHRPPR